MPKAFLFIDRDGTLIDEPFDKQVDSLTKLAFKADVIPSLLFLQKIGFGLVMVSNQDGLGTDSFPQQDFELPHNMMMNIFSSQGINFDEVLLCPHLPADNCQCRKPQIGLIKHYLLDNRMNSQNSWVIGDRETDIQLAKNMNIKGIRYLDQEMGWKNIVRKITNQTRHAKVYRKTGETSIAIDVDLDTEGNKKISTGLPFFDHMLDQIATHGKFSLQLTCQGDLEVDDHHTIEDCALVLGEAIRKALGSKYGISRFGFVLPMDETETHCSLDLSGRPYLVFNAKFMREQVGGMATEMVEHFFRSFSNALQCTLHLNTKGENTHHMVESMFKSLGLCLKQAFKQEGNTLPSSKNLL